MQNVDYSMASVVIHATTGSLHAFKRQNSQRIRRGYVAEKEETAKSTITLYENENTRTDLQANAFEMPAAYKSACVDHMSQQIHVNESKVMGFLSFSTKSFRSSGNEKKRVAQRNNQRVQIAYMPVI